MLPAKVSHDGDQLLQYPSSSKVHALGVSGVLFHLAPQLKHLKL